MCGKRIMSFTCQSRHTLTLVTMVVFLAAVVVVPRPIAAGIVGHWTFQPGVELQDLSGYWGDLQLKDGATIAGGMLDVSAGPTWAIAQGYTGPTIVDKTLVSWVSLDDLNVQSGSALTIDRITSDVFDAIVYGERKPHEWIAGSDFFNRTQDPVPGFAETTTGQLVQMAITYEDVAGSAHVTIYRNGSLIGNYTQGNIASWSAGDAEVLFGIRHTLGLELRGELDAHIEETRIYNEVLTVDQIRGLQLHQIPEPASIIVWALIGLSVATVGWWRRRRRI